MTHAEIKLKQEVLEIIHVANKQFRDGKRNATFTKKQIADLAIKVNHHWK